jgi:hypothetical protein
MSHVTVAASEDAVRLLFNFIRDNFSFSSSDSADFGPFTASYNLVIGLKEGTVDLRDDNTIQVEELDIDVITLQLCLGIDIPEICVGGFCIIPTPFGCALRAPRICIFSADPDISFCLDLGPFLRSEISFTASPVVKYKVDPARTPGMSDLDAEDAGIPNLWQIFINPGTIDLDLFDFADIVGDVLEAAVDAAVDGLLGFLPGWAKDLIKAILGSVIDLIRAILDIPDDIGEWLADLLGVSFGLFNLILTFVADYFAAKTPLHELEDPYPILPASSGLIPVKIPIRDLSVRVNTNEMILEGNVGA